MMRGLGIDIVEVARFAEKCVKPEFLNLVFTEKEQAYCTPKASQAECFAARFAAKEAYMKAVGLGWTNEANFAEIEIVRNVLGKPELVFSGKTKAYFAEQNYTSATLSISHTSQTAVAVVILF